MKTTTAMEDYLKAVWQLSTTGAPATTTAVAERLGVSPPSASAMLKRLSEADWVDRKDGGGVDLTAAGQAEALRVVRRHRLLERFLADVVGVPWDEVHGEAEVLEHVLSPRLEQRIDDLLGHPTHDPHGDPIPPPYGDAHDETWAEPLVSAPAGSRFLVERVSDRDPGALRYLAELGVRPGVELAVDRQEPYGGPLWVTVRRPDSGGEQAALGAALTRLVHGRLLP